ncbi:MAG: proline--tRNA ligase [Deltaproteobacteria bacterium]|nr:proline--tRNA ligase [Deltaproteobacteria bacterium]
MRLTKAFIPTLKELPADAQVASHKLLVRAGFIRQLSAGIYSVLPLAQRSILTITEIVREEMNRIGAQEFYLPALNPREIWEESGRWSVMGDNMFRLKDRKGADLCLAMTHEEIFTVLARAEVRSYRQLPQTWYQIQTKFRDEPRPKSGLLRVRQFTMKDSYSFDLGKEGLDKSFEDHRQAYVKIFTRCGLKTVQVDAHSGAMGGSGSTEFMVRTDAGEDLIASCEACGYAANTEKARSKIETPDAYAAADGVQLPLEEFATPGVVTIEALQRQPYGVGAKRQLKTLVYMADGKPVIAIVRGDDSLNEAKLQTATGANEVRPAHAEEIPPLMGAKPGSLGGVGLGEKSASGAVRVFLDERLAGLSGMVTGANKDGFHLKNVSITRDLSHAKIVDLRSVVEGEGCPNCGKPLQVGKSLEVGHIFKLGTRYSASMGANILGEDGKETPIVMGSYGIGVERILAAAVELHNDADGIRWPMSIAPYHVAILPLQMQDADVRAAAEKLYAELTAAGVEALLDDRDERAGVKFKDADLIGLPLRIAVGKKGLAEGKVEWKPRTPGSQVELVAIADVLAKVKAAVAEGGGKIR